ncbi:MAG: pitrilysin family protein [Nanoarchaeota archaeon]|nr:pitrilysin family protein [Nanoarchaeota archaeon]
MKFYKKVLKNGMTIVMEKRDIPVVSLAICNKFGAGYEESKIKGISHFIEHLVFTGTKTRTHEDISREIEKRGGMVNAFTANQITGFWFKLPSEHLFSGLDILRDILQNPTFDKAKFEKEKKVILEEIKMYHDDPSRNVHDHLTENLYEPPFGENIAGCKESVSALERNFVYNYYKEKYRASNYVVVIVGDANFDKICTYLEKNFPSERSSKLKMNIKKKNAETIEERDGIDQTHFIIGFHAPLARDKNYYSLEVLDTFLAGGMSSKLFLKIREEKGLAYTIQSSINSEKDYSYYSIYLGTTKEALTEVKKIILEELNNISKMTEKDLEEAKTRLIGLKKISKEESIKVMIELIFTEVANEAECYYRHEEKINQVRLTEVKKLALELIKKYSTAVIMPK